MPDTTTNGVPYMLGTDPADEIAVNLQALAEFLDPFVFGMQSGAGLVPVAGGGAVGTLAVVFDRPYVNPPHVVATGMGAGRDVYVDGITVNGFDLHSTKVSAGATNHTTQWVAIGEAVS